jgi:peptide/nickel transport system substrate-binding protein
VKKTTISTAGTAFLAAAALATVPLAGPTAAQTPKRGGIMKFAVVAEPPTIDCHAVTTFAFAHPARAHYSTLLKFKGNWDNLQIVGDLATSWEMAKDGLTYTFKLRDNVKFHDGAPMTSEDVKASYERIINPPPGVVSARRALHEDIKEIETPDATTVVFRMKQPNASMMTHFVSPWNCIYRAAKLKEDPKFPEKTILGTGAFEFVEYKKGESWTARRFKDYFIPDRPYLDGYQAFFVRSTAVAPGIIGGQFDAEFRGRSPAERDQIMGSAKDRMVVVEGPWITNLMFTFNTERKPFDDVRVRQALTMAVDRWGQAPNLAKISALKYVSGLFRPGYEYGLPEAELVKMPGFSKDIEKSRAEARRLLQEAGVSNLKIKLVNRNIAEPYRPGGIFLIDQWRRIGVETDHSELETKLFFDAMKEGNFDVLMEFISDFADDPSAQFDKFLTPEKSSQAASRHKDKLLDQLFDKQSETLDAVQRKDIVGQFERHALTQAYSAPLLWWQRIVVHHKKIKGWELHPSHFTAHDYVDVWLDE